MIDTHIHLAHERYEQDVESVITTAKTKGVEAVVLIGCDGESIKAAVDLHKKHPEFTKLAIGWHPVDVSTWTQEALAEIKKIIKTEDVIAIGEMGLDYHWYPEQKEEQIALFKTQIELAQELDLPIIIHAREAYDDCYNILKQYAPVKGVMHSYADCGENAMRFVELGLAIGISGPITFKNGQNQKETAKIVPLENLLLETDGPYLTPVPYRGKRNLPEYIEYVAEEIALNKNISKQEVIKQTTINAKKLFGGN